MIDWLILHPIWGKQTNLLKQFQTQFCYFVMNVFVRHHVLTQNMWYIMQITKRYIYPCKLSANKCLLFTWRNGGRTSIKYYLIIFSLNCTLPSVYNIMRIPRELCRSNRQMYRILRAQRFQYHDLSRASVIGTAVQNSSEFQVRVFLFCWLSQIFEYLQDKDHFFSFKWPMRS